MRRSNRPIGIDLFAGAGGLSLGFEQAGFDIKAAVEIDPIHAAVHKFNFPTCTTICESVVPLTGSEIRRRAGLEDREIDVVFGGAPCQGFSMIGKRALDDPRNSLVRHFFRLVLELNAKYFVFENVRGLTVGEHRNFLHELIALFKDSGYFVREPYQVLNASEFDIPQDRRRLFLLGCRSDQSVPNYPSGTGSVTVEEALRDLPNADDYDELLENDSATVRYFAASAYGRRLRGLDLDPRDFSYPRLFDPKLLTSSLRTEHTKVSKDRFRRTMQGKVEPVSRFLKLDPNGVCNTLRAGTDSARGAFTSPRPIHPVFPRVITVREAARLHSYPDWFRFHVTKWHGFREIGNSVPPLLGRSVASQVMSALRILPKKPSSHLALGDASLLKFDMSAAAKHFSLALIPISTRTRDKDFKSSQLYMRELQTIYA
jgi:DNA (cytosine-5)-methyltransferase 1